MKFKKTLSRDTYQSFFWDEDMDVGLCINFIKSFISIDYDNKQSVDVTVSTNNPKKKGFRKVERIEDAKVNMGRDFSVCYSEQVVLNKLGINPGESFWVKVDEI